MMSEEKKHESPASDRRSHATGGSPGRGHGYRVINAQLIQKATPTTATKGEALSKFMGRVTHLNLNNKKIRRIENLDSCTKLRVLYLYENEISVIENMQYFPGLSHLYLQSNMVAKMEGLMSLRRLEKLFLDRNSIEVVEGLEECFNLQELHVSCQNLPAGKSLRFDDHSMAAISESLEVLNVSGNNLTSLEPFAVLHRLETLNASRNKITDVQECFSLLDECYGLRSLDLRRNPLTKVPKYWDKIVIHSRSLTSLDDRKVDDKQREFLLRFEARKAQLKGAGRGGGRGARDGGGGGRGGGGRGHDAGAMGHGDDMPRSNSGMRGSAARSRPAGFGAGAGSGSSSRAGGGAPARVASRGSEPDPLPAARMGGLSVAGSRR